MKKISILVFVILLWGCSTKSENRINFEKIFGSNEQTFKINDRKDTILVGQKGTHIRVPKYLLSQELSDNDTIKVVLKEFYTISDMLLAGLSTTSNGKILQTNGMIKLSIYLNNKKINK